MNSPSFFQIWRAVVTAYSRSCAAAMAIVITALLLLMGTTAPVTHGSSLDGILTLVILMFIFSAFAAFITLPAVYILIRNKVSYSGWLIATGAITFISGSLLAFALKSLFLGVKVDSVQPIYIIACITCIPSVLQIRTMLVKEDSD